MRSPPPCPIRASPLGGCSCSAARPERCCSPSPCLRPRRFGARSPSRGDASPGRERGAGRSSFTPLPRPAPSRWRGRSWAGSSAARSPRWSPRLPAPVASAAAIGAARLLLPVLRALGRIGRRGPVPLRLASLSLARNPGQAAVVATFLVASLGLALFAIAYRSTLLHGQHDEAYYAVPAPYVATEDFSQLIPVLHGWHGAPATRVVRLSGNVTTTTGFTFLGVPA